MKIPEKFGLARFYKQRQYNELAREMLTINFWAESFRVPVLLPDVERMIC